MWLLLLPCYLFLSEQIAFDFYVQNFFFVQGRGWLDSENMDFFRLACYKVPKKLIIIFGIFLILKAVFEKVKYQRINYHWLYVIVCLAIIPAFISGLKAVTHVYCPYQVQSYGGFYHFVPLWENNLDLARGRCFPAGHASGDFSLISLYFIAPSTKKRYLSLCLICVLGLMMAGYQMVNGRHFLSHTLTSLWISITICWGLWHGWFEMLILKQKNSKS